VQFHVLDTGIGIGKRQQPRLFQSFVQGDDSMSRKYGGTGLGLAISKQLVEMLGGEIGVESELLQGSRFWFRLPLRKLSTTEQLAALAANAQAPRAEEPPAPRPAGAERARPLAQSGPRILLAEDSPLNQKLTRTLLEKAGYRVEVAANGREAVDAASKFRFDLILMDCQMPEMDGYEATRVLRRREESGQHTPIIALTAHAMTGDRETCLEAGMDDYLTKPIHAAELRKMIEHWLGASATDNEGETTPPLKSCL
jgi:CheY-like chemotaxis protein